jgi:hypothetical protein
MARQARDAPLAPRGASTVAEGQPGESPELRGIALTATGQRILAAYRWAAERSAMTLAIAVGAFRSSAYRAITIGSAALVLTACRLRL